MTREAKADVEKALQIAGLTSGNGEDLSHLSKRLELGYRFSAAVAALYRVYQFHHDADHRCRHQGSGRVENASLLMWRASRTRTLLLK